jgi:hypothetical protein
MSNEKGVSFVENAKLQVCRGIILYLLESTNYTLKNIADLSNSSLKNIHSIYLDEQMPKNFSSELRLVKLYQFILEIRANENNFTKIPAFILNLMNKNNF